MGDFNLGDTSLPERMNDAEKEIHTLLFRMDQFEKQRIPDRLVEVETAVENLDTKLGHLARIGEHTNREIATVRAELNEDIDELQSVVNDRMATLQSSVDRMAGRITGVVTTIVAIATVASFVLDHWDKIKAFLGS